MLPPLCLALTRDSTCCTCCYGRDSMFAAWMLGLDKASTPLGLSHFVQVVRGRTERGFMSSFRTGMIQTRILSCAIRVFH